MAPTQAGLYYSTGMGHQQVSQRSLNSIAEEKVFNRSAYSYDINKFEEGMNHLSKTLQRENQIKHQIPKIQGINSKQNYESQYLDENHKALDLERSR